MHCHTEQPSPVHNVLSLANFANRTIFSRHAQSCNYIRHCNMRCKVLQSKYYLKSRIYVTTLQRRLMYVWWLCCVAALCSVADCRVFAAARCAVAAQRSRVQLHCPALATSGPCGCPAPAAEVSRVTVGGETPAETHPGRPN